MVKCLQASLTKAAALQIMTHLAFIIVDFVMMVPLLFKLIIHLGTIDSKATSKELCKDLQTLDSYMTTYGSDIDKFYLYFYINYNQLVGQGEHMDKPLSLLLDGTRFVRTVF